MTVVVQLTHDGSGSRLDEPAEWLRATRALAHFDSVLPGFGIIPPDHPTAYIEFPGRSQLDASPNRAFGHSVEALVDGNHMLVGRLGQSQGVAPAPPELRNPDGLPLNLRNPHSGLSAEVHLSMRTFGGGSAFVDQDENGAPSEGERFPAPTGMNERLTSTTVPLSAFAGSPLPVYYLPPGSSGSLQPDSVVLKLASVTRAMTRRDTPSTSMERICARLALDSLFMVPRVSEHTAQVKHIVQSELGLRTGSGLTPLFQLQAEFAQYHVPQFNGNHAPNGQCFNAVVKGTLLYFGNLLFRQGQVAFIQMGKAVFLNVIG